MADRIPVGLVKAADQLLVQVAMWDGRPDDATDFDPSVTAGRRALTTATVMKGQLDQLVCRLEDGLDAHERRIAELTEAFLNGTGDVR